MKDPEKNQTGGFVLSTKKRSRGSWQLLDFWSPTGKHPELETLPTYAPIRIENNQSVILESFCVFGRGEL